MTVTLEDLNGTINWIKDYFDDCGIEKAVVGLSGGIDSAVIASLCVRVLGKENIIGVILPCYSQLTDSDLAVKLARNLNIDVVTIDLENTYDNLWADYRHETSGLQSMPRSYNKLVPANIKARLRMTTLYAVAGHVGGLVVGTTNKTEALLGYATKYGDGGVDIEPIQDFYKTEVYELAALLNDIPNEIIHRAPSAGLWDGQTDESELGMNYSDVDHYLKLKEARDPYMSDVGSGLKHKVEDLIAKNKHKDMHLPYYKRNK